MHGARAGRYEAQHLAEWLCEHWGRPARRALASWTDHPELGAAAAELLNHTPAPPEQPVALRVLGETRARPGEKLRLAIDPTKLHLFEPDSEKAIH